ncbi:MAG: tRNA pseudouridine(54/55) synthase Pus10 [Planctomycetota bacterium]
MSDAEVKKLPNAKVFVEGRYRKLCRDLPQTVFFCPVCKGHPRRRRGCERCEGFGKLTRDSVQELVGWVAGSAFKTRKNKFHGAGREDIDVRMLGDGRPFVLEMVNPKCLDVDLAALEAEINRRNEGRLEVRGLHWTEKNRVRVIKETPHAKEYEARVEIDGDPSPATIAGIRGRRFAVTQQTPARVAHRRADKARERWVEFVDFERVTDAPAVAGKTTWLVRIRTEHGTYVKEAVNGESGATKPSLAELLELPCRCVELDVVAILDVEGKAEEIPRAPAVFGENV